MNTAQGGSSGPSIPQTGAAEFELERQEPRLICAGDRGVALGWTVARP